MPMSRKAPAKTSTRKKSTPRPRPGIASKLSRAAFEATTVTPSPAARELSGATWVQRFPGSKSPDDLKGNFKTAAKAFLVALSDAGASVTISATFRPPERAYLMHFAWAIAHGEISPRDVPPMPGVDIEWVHSNGADSRAAAQQMVEAYGMAFTAALHGRHMEGRAIDMSIAWSGTLNIKNKQGEVVSIATTPRGGANTRLHAVGRSYGVIKLVSDPPHWSDDGH